MIYIKENNEVTSFSTTKKFTLLPDYAGSSLNRCNLPAAVLGGLTYQKNPVALQIDCVTELHAQFFIALQEIEDSTVRALHFCQYMCSAFLLGHSEDAGYCVDKNRKNRNKIDYLRLLRGWMFNPDGVEAAVMKRWVESRFGLLTINHHGLLDNVTTPLYLRYQAEYNHGLYNTNALESQLDLLYTYSQYELHRADPHATHRLLYRGVNHIEQHKNLGTLTAEHYQLLLNNLNSFSSDRYSTESFGDVILEMYVPISKILYFPELLTGTLKGENEYLVIGGVYQAKVLR